MQIFYNSDTEIVRTKLYIQNNTRFISSSQRFDLLFFLVGQVLDFFGVDPTRGLSDTQVLLFSLIPLSSYSDLGVIGFSFSLFSWFQINKLFMFSGGTTCQTLWFKRYVFSSVGPCTDMSLSFFSNFVVYEEEIYQAM